MRLNEELRRQTRQKVPQIQLDVENISALSLMCGGAAHSDMYIFNIINMKLCFSFYTEFSKD